MVKKIKDILITRHVVSLSLLYIFLIAYLAIFLFGNINFDLVSILQKYWFNNIFFTIALLILFITFMGVLIKIKYKKFKWKSFLKLYNRRLASIFILKFLLAFAPIVLVSSTNFIINNIHYNIDNKIHFLFFFVINTSLIISLLIMLIFYKIFKNRNDFIVFEPFIFLSIEPFLFIFKKNWIDKKVKRKLKSLINSIKIFFKRIVINKIFAYTQKNILLTVRKGSKIPLI
ncbi:hypothetical protein [Spiroplasma taiwanense]|uniref:Transmembrane protein n=1 Tax=Spiroplasma taiwanense CT-1 TaxID=1276220 RepID=S5LXS4_9MOLU|nr:hypothetical protein [Spiroplasma taiwanense]AGR41396.1 hypothetical protein STAIW_v1c08080 [Spiroplasma taiwanense CT-1]